MEDLQDKIIELMDLFDDEVVTTADKIDRPQRALDREAIDDFMKRNPMMDGGMLVQPSADGSRPGYAKARYDDPRSNIKVGDELGKGIQQRKIDKYTRTGFPKYISSAGIKKKGESNTLTTNSLEDAIEAKKTLIEKRGGLDKRKRLEGSYEVLSEDPLFEKFFKEQIESNQQIKKAMKANNLTKSNSLEEIFNALSKEATKSANLTRAGKKNPSGVSGSAVGNLQRTFNKVFKPKQKNIGKLTVNDLVKKLDDVGIKTTPNMIRTYLRYGDSNYKVKKYPVETQAYINEQQRLRSGKAFVNTLKDLGINVERFKADPNRPSRAKPGANPAFSAGQIRFDISESQFKNLAQSNFFQEDPTYGTLLDKFTSQSKKSDEYKLNLYRKDSENIMLLKRNLNKTIDSLSDTELKNFIENNPKLKNLVTSYFDSETGEIKNYKTLDEVSNLRDKIRFERDHIRGRSTVKYDPATKKIMDGLDIEYPKNLYIVPRGVNNATKRTVENYVALNPNEKTKIKKIDKWFKDNDLTYYDRNNNKYRGATPKITNTDLSHLGLTNEQVLLSDKVNPKTGELVIEKGPVLLERIKERNKFLSNLVANSKLPKCTGEFKAEGGRIGFKFSDECIRDGLNETKKKAVAGDKKAARQLVETAEAASKGGRLLKNVLGPGAILGEAVFEGAIIGNKVLGGKPLKQAWAESYLSYLDPRKYSGELDPTLLQREQMLESTADKNILRSGFAAQDQLSAFNKALQDRELAKARGRTDQYNVAAADAREQGRFADQSADIISSEAFKDASNIAQEYIQGQEGQRMFPFNQFKQSIGGFESGEAKDFRRRKEEEMKNLYEQYSDDQIRSFLKQELGTNDDKLIDRYLELTGVTKRITPAVTTTLSGLDVLRTGDQIEQAKQRIADAGGVANLAKGGRAGFMAGTIPGGYGKQANRYLKEIESDMHKGYQYYKKHGGKKKFKDYMKESMSRYFADGGIAGLSGGVKSGPPPESGPMSQGLQGLLNRGKNI